MTNNTKALNYGTETETSFGKPGIPVFRRHHVLHHLLPPQSTGSQNYNLRQRTHNFALPSRSGHLTDNNIIQRMLYFDVY